MSNGNLWSSGRIIGTYSLHSGQSVAGELILDGAKTVLTIHSEEEIYDINKFKTIRGTTRDGKRITLFRCFNNGVGYAGVGRQITQYTAEIYPEWILIGNSYADDAVCNIKLLEFSTEDLATIFYDFKAFGTFFPDGSTAEGIIKSDPHKENVRIGDRPVVSYFSGESKIFETRTKYGKISASHRPRFTIGSPLGASMENTISISIEPDQSVGFYEITESMFYLSSFLSVAAGRGQNISNIRIVINEDSGQIPSYFDVYQVFGWKIKKTSRQLKPSPSDVPFDPIAFEEEFSNVLTQWIDRQDSWSPSRGRYLECLRKGRKYSIERFVTSANMFDVLPTTAVPRNMTLSDEFLEAKIKSIKLFRELPSSLERDSALSNLARLGGASLVRKILHRTYIVCQILDHEFPNMEKLVKFSVRMRNFFVHGSDLGIEYARVEKFISFLTDMLQFIFAASDLIECGWDAKRWSSKPYGNGHSFTRFRAQYNRTSHALLDELTPRKSRS